MAEKPKLTERVYMSVTPEEKAMIERTVAQFNFGMDSTLLRMAVFPYIRKLTGKPVQIGGGE